VLLVDFSDVPATPQRMNETLQLLALDTAAVPFFRNVSYNQLKLHFFVLRKWLRMRKPSMNYSMHTYIGYYEQKDFLDEAVNLGIDNGAAGFLSQSGAVLAVSNPSAFNIKYGPAFCVDYPWGLQVPRLNKTFYNGVTSGADLNYWSHYWYVHELGHNLGFPDLYDRYYTGDWRTQFKFTGDWDVMGNVDALGREMFAYERWFAGWLNDSNIDCALPASVTSAGRSVNLSAVEDGDSLHLKKLAVVKVNSTFVVCVEFRLAIGGDAGIQRPGVLLYVVDGSARNGGPVKVVPVNNNDGFKWNATLAVGGSVSYAGVAVKFVSVKQVPGRNSSAKPVSVAQVLIKRG
jgi:M6 family metalloprotease-like protein